MNIDSDENVRKHGAFYYVFWGIAGVLLLWLNYDYLHAHLSSNAEKINDYIPQYDELEKYELPAVASWFYLKKAPDGNQDTGYYFGSGYRRQNVLPKILVVPQNGYKHSADVTAKAYWRLAQTGKKFKNVIMLIPECGAKITGIYLPFFQALSMPQGNVPVNADMVRAAKAYGWKKSEAIWKNQDYWKKHLFFLMKINQNFSVLPVIYGNTTAEELEQGLRPYLYDDETLFVFFADLSVYYEQQKQVQKSDEKGKMPDWGKVEKHPCGNAGIQTALHFAKELRMSSLLVNGYSNDGAEEEIKANWKYESWLNVAQEKEKDMLPTLIELEAESIRLFAGQYGQDLLKTAEESLEKWLQKGKKYKPSRKKYDEKLFDKGAVFVTLFNKGTMRGEAGSLRAKQAVVLDVAENARAAASEDVRFDSVKPEELADLEIRITFLTDYERLNFDNEDGLLALLQPETDGIVLRDGNRQGLFLPAMWQEFPDKKEFLTQLKLKAGMSPTYWSDKLKAYRFRTVEIKKNGN